MMILMYRFMEKNSFSSLSIIIIIIMTQSLPVSICHHRSVNVIMDVEPKAGWDGISEL